MHSMCEQLPDELTSETVMLAINILQASSIWVHLHHSQKRTSPSLSGAIPDVRRTKQRTYDVLNYVERS